MISLRKTVEEDIDEIYKYIHSDYVKKYFQGEEEIQLEAHKKWYRFLINSSTHVLYTVSDEKNKFLGCVNFELEGEYAIINIYLVKNIREHGYSPKLIKISIEELLSERKEISMIFAYILEENIVSIKVFEKNGFLFDTVEEYKGTEHKLFIKYLY